MAQHPSLRSQEKGKQHRSVLKRHERIKELKDKEKWKNGDSVFGLPKLKTVKFKIKKEKAEPAKEAAEVTVGTQPQVNSQASPAAKGAAKEAKAAPKKEASKKSEGKKK